MFIDSYSYVDGNTYITWYPLIVNGEDGIFILHAQGSLRKLSPWFREIKKFGKPIYFCDSSNRAWDNHREQVGIFDNGNIIYKLKGI